MSGWGAVEYSEISELRGPLLAVRGTEGAAWDEYVTIHSGDDNPRHGVLLEVDRDLAVVQVFEGTGGLDPRRTSVRCSGSPLRIPVGEEWLGRVCNGRGAPLDGGPRSPPRRMRRPTAPPSTRCSGSRPPIRC